MQKVSPTIKTTHYINCPSCKVVQNEVSHLFELSMKRLVTFGPWYCDSCGCAYIGEIIYKVVSVEIIPDERKDTSIAFLKFHNTILVVEGMYFNGELDQESDRFFYEEHECPTPNITHSILKVIDLDNWDSDQHGLFTFIGSVKSFSVDDDELLLKTAKQLLIDHNNNSDQKRCAE